MFIETVVEAEVEQLPGIGLSPVRRPRLRSRTRQKAIRAPIRNYAGNAAFVRRHPPGRGRNVSPSRNFALPKLRQSLHGTIRIESVLAAPVSAAPARSGLCTPAHLLTAGASVVPLRSTGARTPFPAGYTGMS
jgi:hypothetical protein